MLNKIHENFEIEELEVQSEIKILSNRLFAKKDYFKLEEIIESRLNDPIFIESLNQVYSFEKTLEEIDNKINIAKGKLPGLNGKKEICYVDVRTHSLQYREIYEQMAFLRKKLDDYRGITARIISYATSLRDDLELPNKPGIQEYSSPCIGNFVLNNNKPKNNEEWAEYKLGGIGGHDVSKVMKSHPKYGNKYYNDLLNVKAGLTEKEHSEPTPATQRGNIWEKYILFKYIDNNPHKNIQLCSSYWVGKRTFDFIRAKFDGLELDDKGNPLSIIEIKTGTLSNEWGNTSDPFDNVPVNYRQQAIWYAKNAQLPYATIIAVLDDIHYREYHLDMSDPRVIQEWDNMLLEVRDFWNKVADKRKGIATSNAETIIKEPKSRKGFPKALNMKDSAYKLSAYTGEDFTIVYDNVKNAFSKMKKIHGNKLEQSIIQDTLTNLYACHNPNDRKNLLIGIDIETNGLSPKQGRIIETGLVASYPDGTHETLLSSLHDIPIFSKIGMGTGASEVHRIKIEDLDNKPYFEEDSVQKTILQALKLGTMVSHNHSFERDWLVVNLEGFAEMLDNNEVKVLDTMQICSNLMIHSTKNTLECFSEDNGVAYEGAHNAITDTLMMMSALRNFQNNLYQHKKPIKFSANIESRKESIELANLNDLNRKSLTI